MTRPRHVIIVGAGAGGLAASIELAALGYDVSVIERATWPGGKMRNCDVDGTPVANGPTVFTMRWVIDSLFQRAGHETDSLLTLTSAARLARHAWPDGAQLDLFADIAASADAIADFAGPAEADGYRRLCADAAGMHETLRDTFIAAQKPNALTLAARVGFHRPRALWETRPFDRFAKRLENYFRDPRLVQLFGRYATYVGSSPFLAPATLMVIAHVEQAGVWLVKGGMPAVAEALCHAAADIGVTFQFGTGVSEILTSAGRAIGVRLDDGTERLADAVVFNGDSALLASGGLGPGASRAAPAVARSDRSLSAVTLCMKARVEGFDLDYHTVFFGPHYADEFGAVFERRRTPDLPTIYVCAQDRTNGAAPDGPERLFLLVNAPADGDTPTGAPKDTDFPARTLDYLNSFGLRINPIPGSPVMTRPSDFNIVFPGAGGALYGRANHGPLASFARPGSRSQLPGLYLAGGSCHPGAGVPMAMLSGRLAAEAIAADLDR